MIDSLQTYDTLKKGEIPDLQARAMTTAIKNAESDIALDVKTVFDRRFDEFQAAVDRRFDEFQTAIDRRFDEFQTAIDRRFGEFQTAIDRRFDEFSRIYEARFDQFETKFATKAELAVAVAKIETKLVRWMFLFWIGQVAVMVGLIKVIH